MELKYFICTEEGKKAWGRREVGSERKRSNVYNTDMEKLKPLATVLEKDRETL